MGIAVKAKTLPPNEVDRFVAKVPGTNIWMTRFATGGGYFSLMLA